jgi:hypothetical protein
MDGAGLIHVLLGQDLDDLVTPGLEDWQSPDFVSRCGTDDFEPATQ